MKINESISPSVFKNLIILVGIFLVFSAWKAIEARVADIRYLPVYGESFSNDEQASKVDLKSLPIVVAKSVLKSIDNTVVNDLVIEQAFKVPEFVELEVEEPTKISVSERMFLTYRPAVMAVSPTGAIISGVFWRVGEQIKSMPVTSDEGVIYPVIGSVSRSQVVLKISDEVLTLPIERF